MLYLLVENFRTNNFRFLHLFYEASMQTFYRLCFFLCSVFSLVSTGYSQSNFKNSNLSTQGKEFWLAVPLNDSKAQPTLALEFYVTSKYNTLVILEVPGTAFISSKKLVANQVVIFTTKNGSATYDFEVLSSQIADPRGIHIFADKPISVYMMNAKEVSADGYLALPVRSWGTEYIHCAYYDFGEVRPWAAGFIVVASEDNTKVSIALKGTGGSVAQTSGGTKIGQTIDTITLNRGEIYNVKGDATTRGVFDLTGSQITASKPIGLISYHERAMLPSNNINGRDHMCEMIPPVSAWGKKYYSIELQRANKGDFYRVVSSQPNTNVKMRYYDKVTKELLGKRDIVLTKAGDFYEDFNSWAGTPGAVTGFTSTTAWESDKPILVMQYAYSSEWDSGKEFDPFMVVVTPQEQFLSASVFQTPVNPAFVNNYFSFIIEGDSTDTDQKKLKSFNLDGKNVYVNYTQLLTNQIPGTNLYWGRVDITPGSHTVKADTRFGGYCYGFGAFNSYGWPANLNTRCLAQMDTLPPVITRTGSCGDYKYHATEIRDSPSIFSDTNQFDQGIMDISLVDSVSTNYTLELITASKIIPLPKVTVFDFKLTVTDRSKDAYAIVEVLDRAGNYVLDTVHYTANQPLTITPKSLALQVDSPDTTLTNTITITNPTKDTVFIESISLGNPKAFTISKGAITSTFALAPDASHTIIVDYKSITASSGDESPERDTLHITFSSCAASKHISLEGKYVKYAVGVSPSYVSMPVSVVDSIYTSTVTIENTAKNSATKLNISLGKSQVFTLTNGDIKNLTLQAGDTYTVEIQYKRTSALDTLIDLDTLLVESTNGKTISVPVEGKFAKSLINVSSTQLVFHATGVDSSANAPLTITNVTQSTISLHSLKLSKGSVFAVTKGNFTSDVILAPENSHYVTVEYVPNIGSVGKIDRDTLRINVIGGLERIVALEGQIVPLGVEESISSQSDFRISAKPNPADESVFVTLSGNRTGRVHLRLFDAIGREISTCSAELENASTIQLLNIAGLPLGTYRLVAASADGLNISTILLLIQR